MGLLDGDRLGSITDEVGLCAEAAGLSRERTCQVAEFAKERGESLVEALVSSSRTGPERCPTRYSRRFPQPWRHITK